MESEEVSIKETVPWALTLSATVMALGMNIFLLTVLVKGGPVGGTRSKGNSLLVLTATEISLTLFLCVHLTLHRLNWAHQRSSLESGFHSLHTVRNGWLLVLTSCRTLAVVRPLRSRPDWFNWRQQGLAMLLIVSLSAALVFASSALTTAETTNAAPPGLTTTAAATEMTTTAVEHSTPIAELMTQRNATPRSVDQFRDAIRPALLRFASLALFGTLLPGLGVVCLGCRMAWALRRQTFQHSSSRRSCKMVLMLSFGFAALEFPFATLQVASVGYMLAYPFETVFDMQPAMLLLEFVTSWGMLCVPLDSCLNFVVLMGYSRTFRASLQRMKRRNLPAGRSPRPSAATDSASKRLQVAATCV